MSESWKKVFGRFSAKVSFLNAALLMSATGIAAVGGISHQAAAVEGNGTFVDSVSANPSNFFPVTSNDGVVGPVLAMLYENLLDRNWETNEWEPLVASKWETSADGKEFTFTIDPKAKFSNGDKITAEDIKFSFDVIFMDGVDSAPQKPYYEQIKKIEVLAADKIKFVVKDVYFKNFEVLAQLTVLPKKHYMELYKKDKTLSKLEVTRNAMGSNMWNLEKWDDNQQIVFKRNANYWNKETRIKQNRWNFEKYVFKIIPEAAVEFEAFKKGDLTNLVLSPKQWAQQSDSEEFKTRITKVQTVNKMPKGYAFVGWNQKNPILANKDVRWALAHIANIGLWIKKFEFDLTEPTVGPFSVKSDDHDPSLKPVEFDLKKAKALLATAGWTTAGKDGFLIKDGKKFEVTIMYPTQSKDRWEPRLTEFKNSAAKVGVSILLKAVEWTSFTKLLDEHNFDAVAMGWSRGFDQDLKQIWHSSSSQNNGSNFISYSNKEVDKLIEMHRQTLDRAKRTDISRKMQALIMNDQPYVFITEPRYSLYGHQKTVEKGQDTYKYNIGEETWKIKAQAK